MKVLFLPNFSGNPYQQNLKSHLANCGVDVEFAKINSFQELGELCLGKDVLHVHWTHPYLIGSSLRHSMEISIRFFLLMLKAKIAGSKLVWTVHNLGEHERKFPVFEKYMHMFFARMVNVIITHSQFAKDKVVDRFHLTDCAEKIHIVPHGHYIDNYKNDISGKEARAELGISLSKKVLLFFGLIRPYKGLPELIAAFDKISEGNELLILAGRPYDEHIKTEISDLVADRKDILFYPGFVADERMQVYMNAADAVVFPFKDIFTSGSVLLAMSFAKAIVVPKLESLSDVIGSGGAVTYDPESEAGLEFVLENVLYADIEELGRLSFDFAKKFSWKSIANDTCNLYESCLSGNRD